MSTKQNILESWIMVEHLSEGDIKLRDRTILTFNELQNDDFYSFFLRKINQKRGKNRGVVVYFGVFSFKEIVAFFRDKFNMEPMQNEVPCGDKFSLALYFDKDLKLNSEMTFLTESYYIKMKREIPKEKVFREFETDRKKELEEIFMCPENYDYPTFFNEAIVKVFHNYGFLLRNCRFKPLSNIETEDTNLHSFFIADLEKAKTISTGNLDSYLLGKAKTHVDLDCRATSPKFNSSVFYDILQPKNYPIGRFPSNPEHALYFMQQVAVNLAMGYDKEQIRSVNGPPGTGKTTLLKDVFAELIVEQAYDIVKLSAKSFKGGAENRYWDKATIGSLPEKIAAKGIVAVSSNNGAVQNIVNEMTLTSQISDEFAEALNEADYFKSIANSKVGFSWLAEDGKTKRVPVKEPNEEPDRYWGLFSLEGGSKANMEYVSTVLEHVVEELRKKYTPDTGVYADFKKQYDKVIRYRKEKQAVAEKARRARTQLKKKSGAEKLRKAVDGTNANELDLSVDYNDLQLSNPWFDIEYRRIQTDLFISALKVRKQFLYDNIKNIKAAVTIWNKQKDHLDHKHIITEAWNWINMVIPVIGSTFASFGRMCSNMGKNSIGYLFIDEAGQAIPQASVGAIFRSRQVMAVGDPSQIKPVLTLDPSILSILRDHYGVYEKYISEDASTQTLIDEISKYGFYKENDKTDWIGIPLWVHRRCHSPMFDISNRISYGGNMVQAVPEIGKSEWYDCGGMAQDKYVSEQGQLLIEKIQEMIESNEDILNKEKDDIIYVISPFRNVAYQLSVLLRDIGFTRYEKNKPTNVGTVHTFQGKEAPIVFLVLGADNSSKGAANWAVGTSNPNIMNVAATRAKEEFYIIGDKKLYLGLNSDVINDTYEIIERFGEEPD